MLLAGLILPLGAQQPDGEAGLKRYNFSQVHLGTVVRLVFYCGDRAEAKALAELCFTRVRQLDAVFSDYRDDSELMLLCAIADKKATRVSDELFAVLSCAQKISEQSGGVFDVTLGASSKAWRMEKEGKVVKSEPDCSAGSYRDLILDDAAQTVRFNKRLSLDLGGIAKGYIADELVALLRQHEVTRLAVLVGGEICVADPPPGKVGWPVDLEDPDKKVIGTMMLKNSSLSTSGDSYQFAEIDGKHSAHVLDPKTGKGKQDRLNVSVIAPSTMQADAWATALRVLGAGQGAVFAEKIAGVEVMFSPANEEVKKTEGFPAFKK